MALSASAFYARHDIYDALYRSLNPVEYWTNKVIEEQKSVESLRRDVLSCQLELPKIIQTSAITIRQSVLAGHTHEKAVAEYREKLASTRDACDFLRNLLAFSEKELNDAKNELAKHQ